MYSLVSSAGVALNARTEDAVFRLRELLVYGSFITDAHLVARIREDKELRLSFSGAALNDKAWSYRMVNGTCGGAAFVMGPKAAYQCDDLRLSVDLSTLTMVTRQWRFKLSGRPIYGRISGPLNRLDISVEALVDESSLGAHGLIGQSFDGSKVPRYGRVDQYPPLEVPAEFTTAAMAEGAIEGAAKDYEVADKYATQFRFSRFALERGPNDAVPPI